MVAIRQRRNPFRKEPKKSSGICTIRNVFLALIVVQGVRMLVGSIQHNNGTVPVASGGVPPPKAKGVADTLGDSKQSIRGANKGNNNNNNITPEKPKHVVPHPEIDASHHEDYMNAQNEHVNKGLDERPPKPPSGGGTQKSSGDPFEGKDIHPDPDEHQMPDDPVDEMVNKTPEKKEPQGDPKSGDPIHSIVLDKKGTGPTKVGYVKDFDYERAHPAFRMVEIPRKDVTKSVAAAVEETAVKPCLDETTNKINPICLDTDTTLIAYNAAKFPRSWCGTDIDPGTASTLHQHCTDPVVHLFAMQSPPVNGHGMTPIIIKSHEETEIPESDLETIDGCDIPCKQEMGLSGDVRYIHGESWQIIQPQGDNYENGNTKIERINYRFDKYYSTQSFLSSVPRPLFDWDAHELKNKPATDFDTAKDKAFYLVNKACASQSTKRGKYFDAVKRFFPVDSFGTCHKNAEFPEGMDINKQEDRVAVMRQYKIVLAFDVSSDKDHISGMIWEALQSGAVPVVIGADNIKDHLPPHSFVSGGDYGSWDDLATYIKSLANNRTDWESYHKWRTDAKSLEAMEKKYEFAHTGPTCRLCRWAYAKKYGMGWDHHKQTVNEPKIGRELCLSENFVAKPFQEAWITRHDAEDEVLHKGDADSCEGSAVAHATMEADAFKLERALYEHDGVIDVRLSDIEHRNMNGEIVFRLSFPGVRNTDGACFQNTHTLVPTTRGPAVSSVTLQDEFVKVTVLADWETKMASTGEGIVEVVILKAHESDEAPRRLRIITEDTTEIHDKMTEFFPSSFAKRMVQDFVDPLEIFYADS